jgi:hypothetical protein
MSDRVTCSGCDATWTGTSPCHCASCHRTFAGIKLFDAHRHARGEHGGCLDPEQVLVQAGQRKGERVMFFRDGMFRGPELSEEQIAKLRGAS